MKQYGFSVMFVCMGNICRSPLAHGIFLNMVKAAGLEDEIFIESSGTVSSHVGEYPDPRMRAEAEQHGIELTHRARQFEKKDLDDFDLVLAMDKSNLAHIRNIAGNRLVNPANLRLFRSFDPEGGKEVPDPYYGGDAGFRQVYIMVERSCEVLLEYAKEKIKKGHSN